MYVNLNFPQVIQNQVPGGSQEAALQVRRGCEAADRIQVGTPLTGHHILEREESCRGCPRGLLHPPLLRRAGRGRYRREKTVLQEAAFDSCVTVKNGVGKLNLSRGESEMLGTGRMLLLCVPERDRECSGTCCCGRAASLQWCFVIARVGFLTSSATGQSCRRQPCGGRKCLLTG